MVRVLGQLRQGGSLQSPRVLGRAELPRCGKGRVGLQPPTLPLLAGFLLARYLFENIPPNVIGLIVAATAGLMIYITVGELIPTSCAGQNHGTIFSLITGVVFVVLLGLL